MDLVCTGTEAWLYSDSAAQSSTTQPSDRHCDQQQAPDTIGMAESKWEWKDRQQENVNGNV